MDVTSSWQRERGVNDAGGGLSAAPTGRRRGLHAWLGRTSGPAWLLILACQGSVQADAHVSTDGKSSDALASHDRPLEEPQRASAPVENDFTVGEYALLGARHDLEYVGSKQATCTCLAVALRDQAKDPAFQWALEAPLVEPSTQWIIAISSNEVPCDAPPSGTLGASYQGYGTAGNDVIVYVEALGEGRPMTNGAIIPRPKPSGSVYVESTNAVYGKPLEGKGKRCKLNPPGSAAP